MDCSFGCGDEVLVRVCSVVMAWITGKLIQVTLDMGCSQLLIRVDFVLTEIVQWSKPVCMRFIHGGSDQYE